MSVKKLSQEELKKAASAYVDDLFDDESEEKLAKAKDCDEEEMEKSEDGEDKPKKKKEVKADADDKENPMFKKGYEAAKAAFKKSLASKIENDNEEDAEEEVQEPVKKAVATKSDTSETEALKKSMQTITDQINDLSGKLAKLAKQPASARRSVRGIDLVKKSLNDNGNADIDADDKNDTTAFLKSREGRERIADVMLEDGVMQGKLASKDIAEFEATGSISDVRTQRIVKSLVSARINAGEF